MALWIRLRTPAVLPADEAVPPRLAPSPSRQRCAEALADEWDFAACVLGQIEADAALAEREAWAAVRFAERREWGRAVRHSRSATALEAGYCVPRGWAALQRLIEAAAGREASAPQTRNEV
jgi:hypothetical protein